MSPSRVYRPRPGLPSWYVDVRTRGGARIRMAAFASEELSWALIQKIERLDELRVAGRGLPPDMVEWLGRLPDRMLRRLERAGLVSPGDVHEVMSLEEHLADWHRHLQARGGTEQHVAQNLSRVEAILAGIGARRWEQIQPHAVEVWLSRLRSGQVGVTGPRGRVETRPRSIRTSNAYLAALRQFLRWAQRQGRIHADPIAAVEPLDARKDLRKRRRALTLEEQRRLLRAVRLGPERGHIARTRVTGPQRALAYRLALEAGLRRGEIEGLLVRHLELEATPPRIVWRAAEVKARRDQAVPLRRGTAAILVGEVAGKLPSARVFPWFPRPRVALKWLREDLATAKIPAVDPRGLEVDWHALRKSSGTLFQRVGGDLDATARFLRHGDARTTRAHYLDDDLPALSRLLEALPELDPGDDEPGEKVAR